MSTPTDPGFVRRIAIVGPESSGKTTLAAALARAFGAAWVNEVARSFLNSLGRPYVETDLVEIGRRQVAAEDAAAARSAADARVSNSPLLFCDTNLLVLSIWSEAVYGRVDPWIVAHERLDRYAWHLLTAPDLPWLPDPLREAPAVGDRVALFKRYRVRLDEAGAGYSIVRGTGEERVASAVDAVRRSG